MKFEKIDCGNGIAVAVSSDSMIITAPIIYFLALHML